MFPITVFEKRQPLFFDGAAGTVFQGMGLLPGERPEVWNLTRPEDVAQLHMRYLSAGADILKTNTFGANRLKFPAAGEYPLEDVVAAGVRAARKAIVLSGREGGAWAALGIGPTGKLLEPLGDLEFEDAVALYQEVAAAGADAGADLILIETMTDGAEAKAAVLGAKTAAPELPVFVTLTFEATGRLLSGGTVAAAAAMLEGLGVAALGVNCGAGPERAALVLPELLAAAHVPVIVNPNAGLPRLEGGQAVFDLTPEEFAARMEDLFGQGAAVLGGCCGTAPDHIAALVSRCKGRMTKQPQGDGRPVVSSAERTVSFGGDVVLIGERINPTGKPALQQALREGNFSRIADEAKAQEQAGVHILDVNVGLPGLDERAVMERTIRLLQGISPLPLQIDSASPAVLEAAMRRYAGCPLVNSVSGKDASMRTVFPLIQKYGGVAVALLLDENGIPATVEDRLAVAQRIYDTAAEYGIPARNLLIDALTLTISAEPQGAAITLETIRQLRARFGSHTVLGVSNISFGLPQRELVNAAFFTMALESGLSAAILNPKSQAMMNVYHSWRLLRGRDPACAAYLDYAAALPQLQPSQGGDRKLPAQAPPPQAQGGLRAAIEAGREDTALRMAQRAAEAAPPLEVITREVIPALDAVGKKFGAGTLFLPQLLQSAAAAKAALEVLRAALRRQDAPVQAAGTVLLATVQGDIHDIGKNIVKTMLETYGFAVIDLGKDVPPQRVLDAARAHPGALVGLSALMTTTVPSMERTIRLLRKEVPACRILVGGAVLTREDAERMGADAYCADAMDGVREAKRLLGQ
ncbi:MAG: homocysteine S-methyltransferase family protein [Oscillospiraceae bacterium]|nr:homocysteine S-methyltransferase family protein [Oscillospiraceae bacterium]